MGGGILSQHPASQAWTRQRARQLWARSYPQQDRALPALVLTPTPEARLAAMVNKILAAEPG